MFEVEFSSGLRKCLGLNNSFAAMDYYLHRKYHLKMRLIYHSMATTFYNSTGTKVHIFPNTML